MYSKYKDASIFEDCFCTFREELHTIVKGDNILVDRDFRDVLFSGTKQFNVH